MPDHSLPTLNLNAVSNLVTETAVPPAPTSRKKSAVKGTILEFLVESNRKNQLKKTIK